MTWRLSGARPVEKNHRCLRGESSIACLAVPRYNAQIAGKVAQWLTVFLHAQEKNWKRCSKYSRFSLNYFLKSPCRVSHPPLNFPLNSQVWLKSFTEGSITDWGMIHFTSEAPKSYLWGISECIYLTCEAFCKINMGIFQFDKSTWNITS